MSFLLSESILTYSTLFPSIYFPASFCVSWYFLSMRSPLLKWRDFAFLGNHAGGCLHMLGDRWIFHYMERELLGAVMTHVHLHLSKEGSVLDKLQQEDLCAFRFTNFFCQKSVGKSTLYYLMFNALSVLHHCMLFLRKHIFVFVIFYESIISCSASETAFPLMGLVGNA